MATYTCTGCKPIDTKIIEAYLGLVDATKSANQAAADAEHAAEHAIGKSPYIGENGDWFEWDDVEAAFIDTGVQAHGSIVVDTEMSMSSTNPVQNKVVTAAVNDKYTKPASGIPASDIASGVIPDVSGLATKTEVSNGLAEKQNTLVSGTNIKTVNGESILGSGNIIAGDPNAVKYTEQSLTDGQKTQARTNIGAGTYTKAGTGIPASDLASGVQTSLGKADTAYQKPGTGIPKTDLASGVQSSLDLADSAIQAEPVGSVTPPVDPSAWATAEEVDQLEHKVDDLSTGKYYGYFADEESLPEGTAPGFAYVGEGPTYNIWNFDGEEWKDSEITVNQSPIGNDEDIDQNEDGKLQFANRVYNAQQPNGMGYKILRKDATFASQVTDTNTIYEVRYPFDLGGATINIPSGCVLRFNGGSLSNGLINGDETQFQGLVKNSLLCGFSGTFADMNIMSSALGLLPRGNSINVQEAFYRLEGLISCTKDITVEFENGVYGYGDGGTTKKIPGGAKGYYNYPAICILEGAINKHLKIIGNGAEFIRIGTTYIGKFDFSTNPPTIDTSTNQSYSHWSSGGGFIYYWSGNLEIENCTIDGNISGCTFGGYQTATQECNGIVVHSGSLDGKKLVIKNFVTDGISSGNTEHITLSDCKLINNIRWGVSTDRCDNFRVDGCLFSGNGRIYKVNEYYRFEGNWGDIDLEAATSDAGEGNIRIINSRFENTGGSNSIVSIIGNIESFVMYKCEFYNNSTKLEYVSSTGGDVHNVFAYVNAINLGTVKNLCEVTDINLVNYCLGYASRGETPLSSYIPEDTSNPPVLYYTKPERKFTYFRNISLSFTEDCTGYLASGTTYPCEIFVHPSTCYNYQYNTETQKWVKTTSITSPYDKYHYGETFIENLVINLIPNLCIGSASATDNFSPLTSEYHGMTINVSKASPKNYIKTFKANASVLIRLTGLVINDYNEGVATNYGEAIYKTVGDGSFVYRNYGNGNYALRLEYRYGNYKYIPETPPVTPICGSTANRPSGTFAIQGTMYYDYELNKPIWWTGSKWVYADGTNV